MEKYCDADPRCGPSGAEHQVVGAVRSTGLVKGSKHFYFDVLSQQVGKERMGELLLEECGVFAPDLIIYTPLGGALGERLNPTHQIMHSIMGLGVKVFLNLWDAPESGLEQQWLPSATLLGVDSLIQNYRRYKHLPNVIFMHSTVDPTVHYDRGLERDIAVSFVGSLDPGGQRWPLRAEYTGFLKTNGVNVVVAGGQRGSSRLPIEEYAAIMGRSRISLDFCRSTDGRPTMHLRSFEVPACGALLMEDYSTLLGHLLEPGKDFLIFPGKEELLELAQYYLAHEDERREIAARGHEKVTRVFNALNMWGYVFERMGFDIPEGLARDSNYRLHKSVLEAL